MSGEIEQLLKWIEVQAGDAFFVPAGRFTPSAAGLALCEIQQHSDITYRLYDYGRPRELHLDKAVQVAFTGRQQRANPSCCRSIAIISTRNSR